MKPLSLTIQNVGPFKNETIDFTALGDMFLISGKTGSGKTTIFDAITYALYGDFPGTRKGYDKELRSDFAQDGEEAFVEFTFLIDKKTYRVRRTLRMPYINRNKKPDFKDYEVTLETIDSSGAWQTFAGKKTEINSKIIDDIIHLNIDEFNQIVLLPQGSFADFLHAKSSDKRETLAKLFPITFYKRIADFAKENADEYSEKSKILQSKLHDASDGFSFEESQTHITQYNSSITLLKAKLDSLQKESSECISNAEKIKSSLDAASATQKLLQQKQELEKERKEIASLEEKLKRSQLAKGLESDLRTKTDSVRRKIQCKSNLASAQKDAAKSSDAVTSYSEQKDEFEELSKQTEKDKLTLDDLKKKENQLIKLTTAQIELKKTEQQLKATKENADKTQQLFFLLSSQLIKGSEKNKNSIKNAESLCTTTQCMIDELVIEQKHAELNSLASTIAASLKENEPCPVCGSLAHPHIAEKNIKTVSIEDKVNAEQKHLENAKKSLESLKTENVIFETTLLSLTEEEKKASIKKQAASTDVSLVLLTAQELSAKLAKLRSLYKTQSEEASKFETKYAAEKASFDQIQSSIGKDTDSAQLRLQIDSLSLQIEQNTEAYTQYQTQYRQTEKNCAAAEAKVIQLKETLSQYTTEAENAEKAFADALTDSPFKTEEDLCDAIIDSTTEQEYRQRTDSWKESMQKTDALLSMQKEHAGTKELETYILTLQNNLAQVQNKHEEIAASIKAATEELNTISIERSKITERIALINKLDKELSDFDKQTKATQKLSDDLNGHNNKNTPFDAWVLAMYFEEVVEYANPRFARISGGRYQFKINTNAAGGNSMRGLDLLVDDSYTGKDRDTATLSGGETFMASISLALALTDVVQNRSGGIRLDSLFIDEGFGTLDGDSLDMAVNVLRSIQEQRVVGIVSHVETLETVIPNKLEVIKGTTGSTVKIR
jgi:exonuclease SbcC